MRRPPLCFYVPSFFFFFNLICWNLGLTPLAAASRQAQPKSVEQHDMIKGSYHIVQKMCSLWGNTYKNCYNFLATKLTFFHLQKLQQGAGCQWWVPKNYNNFYVEGTRRFVATGVFTEAGHFFHTLTWWRYAAFSLLQKHLSLLKLSLSFFCCSVNMRKRQGSAGKSSPEQTTLLFCGSCEEN